MKTSAFLRIILYVAVFHAATSNAAEPRTAPVTATQRITPAGSHPSVAAPAEHFTGYVRINPVWGWQPTKT
jgi:hypothetical protein